MSFLGDFRQAVQDALNVAFADDGVTFEPGRLEDDAGQQGRIAAVTADGWAEIPGRINEADVQISIQLFDQWGSPQDAEATTDPTTVEEWADKLVAAVKTAEHAAGWFLRVTQARIVLDPAGQPTRLAAIVIGRTQNPFETGAP